MCLEVCSLYGCVVQMAASGRSRYVIAYCRYDRGRKPSVLQEMIYHDTEIQRRTAQSTLIAYDIKQRFPDTDYRISWVQWVFSEKAVLGRRWS